VCRVQGLERVCVTVCCSVLQCVAVCCSVSIGDECFLCVAGTGVSVCLYVGLCVRGRVLVYIQKGTHGFVRSMMWCVAVCCSNL